MAATLTNYSGLVSALPAWLSRDGDTDITNRADDFIALMEERLYVGGEAMMQFGLPAQEGVRLADMYTVNASFSLSQTVAQPTGLLEIVEITVNNGDARQPLHIVEESIIDSMNSGESGEPRYVAKSGNNLRFWPDPGTGNYTGTIRYYARLTTPSGTNATNWIMTNAPSVYLNGCLLYASIFTGDFENALKFGTLYTSAVNALNTLAQRKLAAAQNVRVKLRSRTP